MPCKENTAWMVSRKCPQCKKRFNMYTIYHAYYRKMDDKGGLIKYFCSWHCLREYDKLHPNKREQKLIERAQLELQGKRVENGYR